MTIAPSLVSALLKTLAVYLSLVTASVAYSIATTGVIDPEGFGYVIAFDGVIDTATILIVAHVFHSFGGVPVEAVALVLISFITRIALLIVANHVIHLGFLTVIAFNVALASTILLLMRASKTIMSNSPVV